MTNKDILDLNVVLSNLGDIKNKKFAYAVFKNTMAVGKEIEIFEKIKMEPHTQSEAYETERNELCAEWASKDEEGNPVTENNRYVIPDMVGFEKVFNETIVPKYQEVITHIENEDKKFQEFLEKENELELTKISIDDLPDDIDANTIFNIRFMLND